MQKILTTQLFLGYDIIIFDYGLMHRILGTNECVANYLDGGFMRSMWCINHTFALIILPVALYCIRRPLWLLWPSLLMQSAYALGLGVLTMAIAPKLLEAFGGKVDGRLMGQFSIYTAGFCLNWLFTLVLWHYYWYMEKLIANIPHDVD
ncbi:unnamed protein product [Enterobius vermicularis]|uniref:DUF2085 domain-containing protein n=1 Tax=Enterobius vermicularis TaxID=51028 RepID=A0A0N4VK68_ENTVE|nr:unnamed protein product [Enterobius vermicularis]